MCAARRAALEAGACDDAGRARALFLILIVVEVLEVFILVVFVLFVLLLFFLVCIILMTLWLAGHLG